VSSTVSFAAAVTNLTPLQGKAGKRQRKQHDPMKEAVAMSRFFHTLWFSDQGQDIAEYAVMLAVILVLVVGTIRLIGSNSNTVFSNVASAIQ
jgi:Flp pilus assembly pilin Flp